MATEYQYELYRRIKGKVCLKTKTRTDGTSIDQEAIAKLVAEEHPYSHIKKYIVISEQEYKDLQEDVYFQSRVVWLQKEYAKPDDRFPQTAQEIIDYGIEQLIDLCESGKPEQKVRVDSAKALVDIGMEMRGDIKPEAATVDKSALKKVM